VPPSFRRVRTAWGHMVLSQLVLSSLVTTPRADGKGCGRMPKGRHFDQSVILLCIRWYLAYNLSLRSLRRGPSATSPSTSASARSLVSGTSMKSMSKSKGNAGSPDDCLHLYSDSVCAADQWFRIRSDETLSTSIKALSEIISCLQRSLSWSRSRSRPLG